MAWSVLQSVSASTTAAVTTVSATFTTANLTAGTKLVAYVANPNASGFLFSSVKDGAGNSFVQQAHVTFNTNGGLTHDIWALDTPAGDVGTKPTITATLNSANNSQISLVIQEVSGLLAGTSGILDGTAGTLHNGNVAGGLIGPPVYASTASNEFLAYCYADNGAPETMTAPGGYTLDANGFNSSSIGDLLVCSKNSTGTTETGQWSASAAYTAGDAYSMIMAAFKLAAVAPPLTVHAVGSAGTGIFLKVDVLTAATEAGGNNLQISAGTPDGSLTPAGTNSLIKFAGEFSTSSTAFTAAASNTLDINNTDSANGASYCMGHYSGTVTAATPVTAGCSAPSGADLAAYEVRASSGSTPAVDGSSPALVTNTGTGAAAAGVTTASFAPPVGSVLVAMVSVYNATGVTTSTVTSSGLTWTQRAVGTTSGNALTAVWTATVPAAATPIPPLPSPAAQIPPGLFFPGRALNAQPQPSDPSLGPPPPFPPGAEFIPATTPLIVPPFLTPASWSQPWAPRTDPGVVPPGTPSQYHFLLALASQTSGAVSHPLTLAATALAAQPAEQVSLGKKISNPVSVFSSAQKALGKNISSPVAVFSSVKNSIAKTLAAIAVAFSAINVRIGRLISGQLAALASVSMQKVKLLTLAAQAVASSAVTRQVSRTLSGITAVTGSVARQALRTLAAQAAAFTTATRRLLRTLPGQAAVTGTGQNKIGRSLSGITTVTASAVRQLGKGISGVTVTAGMVTRSIARILNAVSAAFALANLTRVKLLSLTAQAVTYGAEKISQGKILSGITVTYSSVQNSLGKKISGTVAAAGSAGRNILKPLTATSAAPGTLGIIKVKLLALAAQIVTSGTGKISAGKILSGITVTYSSLQNSLGKRIFGTTTVTGSAIRGTSRLLSGVTAASGIATMIKVKLLTLAAQVTTYSAERISLGKAVQAVLAAFGTAQSTLRRNMTISAITVTTGTAVRSLGKILSGITTAFSGISSIKVKLLTLAAQVATLAGTTRKISPVISAQVTATGVTIRSVSRKIAAQAVLTGLAVNSLGKKISGTAVAFSSAATQKIRPLVLSALAAVTNAVTRRIGSIQPGTLVTAPSVTRRVTRKIASAMAVNSTVIAGRAFLVKLTAITATSASVVVKISQSAFVIMFKLGTPAFRWITGGLKKVWRIP